MPGPGYIKDRGLKGIVQTDKPYKMRSASWLEPTGAAVFFDDFVGDTLATDNYVSTSTAAGGSGNVAWAYLASAGDPAAGHGGWAQANGSTDADDASEILAGTLSWKASRAGNGLLVFEVNLSTPTAAAVQAWNVGLTDDRSSDKLPMEYATATWTTNASDACMIVYDDDGTAKGPHAQGVKADTDATAILSLVAPANATAERHRIEIDSSGNAYVYSSVADAATSAAPQLMDDGYFKGSIVSAVTAATALCAFVGVETRSATATTNSLEVDYLFVACGR